jgi:hypothetical protein
MRFAITSLVCLAALAASADDMTITSKVTRDGGAPQMATSYISSDRVRIAQPDGNEAILDLKSGEMTVLDGKKKTYYVITQKDIDDMAAMLKERMNSPEVKAAQEKMKNLPPEMQKKMQDMMGGMALTVDKTGTSRTIAGMHCDNWTVSFGQMSKTEECLTNELKLPPQTYDRFRKYMDSMQSVMASMGPMAKNFDAMREQMQKLKGYPIATTTSTNIMGRRSSMTNEVTAVNYGAIPASAWAIPAGYTKIDSPMKQALSRK